MNCRDLPSRSSQLNRGLAFTLALATGVMASFSAQAQLAPASQRLDDRWQFQPMESEAGTVCSIAAKHGKVILGFISLNGQDYRGFVVGLIGTSKRATWRVDEAQPFVTDGSAGTSNKWVTEPLPAELLAHVADGSELSVTSAAGDRVVVGLDRATEAVGMFNDCRYGPGTDTSPRSVQQRPGVRPHAVDALSRSSGAQFTCVFRLADVDGVDVPSGMMTDRTYLRSSQVTRASITFDPESKRFVIGDREVEDVQFTQPDERFPEGAASMPFSSFYSAVSVVAASAAARGLSADHQAQLEGFMKQYSGSASRVAAPNRHVTFDAVANGRLLFFDLGSTGEAVNFSGVSCDSL
jgi:hypothetical protein